MKRVLIVGGTGFLGARLAARRVRRGESVHILARPGSSLRRLEPVLPLVLVHRAASGDRRACAEVMADVAPHEIFHLAARTRRAAEADLSDLIDSAREDLDHLLCVLAAAAAGPRPPAVFLRGGSLAEYGFGTSPPDEDRREAPADAYSAALVAGSHYLRMAQDRLGFPAMTARFGLVYGPTQAEGFFVGDLLGNLATGQTTHVRRPLDRRDAIYVDDVLDAMDAFTAAPQAGAIVNVGSGQAPTMADLATCALEVSGAAAGLVRFETQEPRTARHLMLDCRRARVGWGWQAVTPLRVGLAQTLAWRKAERVATEITP